MRHKTDNSQSFKVAYPQITQINTDLILNIPINEGV
jgi:hypothetical protein